ncbi:MAG: hypothetical protein D6780_06420 [Candidatus Dadabacteria bacterium]|nr:MAG: hypothetical protein D6780_06420 [Candidatus Dadabacteria bacterium]
MKNTTDSVISVRVIKQIKKMINEGDILWGVLTANEYFSPANPVRRQVLAGVKEQLADIFKGQSFLPLIEKVLKGQRLSAFSTKEQEKIRTAAREVKNILRKRFVRKKVDRFRELGRLNALAVKHALLKESSAMAKSATKWRYFAANVY